MNANLIPCLCGGALLLMCGAGASHFIGVQQQVAQHQHERTKRPAPLAAPLQVAPAPVQQPALPPSAVAAITQAVNAQQQPSTDPAIKELTQDLISELRKISRENQNLREQVAETNRDLMEMSFRLETHSKEFRPLRSEETEPAKPINSVPVGVLPPLETGFSE